MRFDIIFLPSITLALFLEVAQSYVVISQGDSRIGHHRQIFRALHSASPKSSLTDPLFLSDKDSTTFLRPIAKVEKYARLPVWPAWNGVFIWLVSNIFGNDAAARLENQLTGRVCPNFLHPPDTSPFVLLVHHCHSFGRLDPLRYVQRTFFPEGFPSHPHRGFTTITYILHGGFVHRDSEGIKQVYGADGERHEGKDVQWLFTGSGLQHEEMFDIDDGQLNSRQELYQIWLNVPAAKKMGTPQILLMGGEDETPVVVTDSSTTRVIAGSYQGKTSIAPLMSDVALFHVTISKNGEWEFDFPNKSFETAFLYVREGSLTVLESAGETEIPVHHTGFFAGSGDTIRIRATDDVDFLFLAGAPLREPCVASGSMVMNSQFEIQQANADYAAGLFGAPWSHSLSDEDWRMHLKQNGPRLF